MTTQDTRWTIDLTTLGLKPADGSEAPTMFTPEEWASQIWPDCPVCGTPITVDPLNGSSQWSQQQVLLMGRWQCPNGCDPRKAPQP